MYVEREIKNKFEKIAKIYPIVALVGPRQAGKTTFLKEQAKNLNSSYLLFDDPDIKEMFEEDIKKFEKQYIEGKEISILDEVNYCKGSGGKLKYLADTDKKVWLTSSSEVILNKEVLSFLVGRVSILRLYPFSLNEFLKAKKQKEITMNILYRLLPEHILYGGYPKVVENEDIESKKIILRDLHETIILKDISKTFSIEDINSLEQFVKYLSMNIGNIIQYEKITSDIRLSFKSIKKYLDAMEKSQLIYRISPFYKNKLKEITKQPKIYFYDTGLRNSIANLSDPEISGSLFENYVCSELIKIGYKPKHWRTKTKAEVDFILEVKNDVIPVEVKISSQSNKIERSLYSFIETYKPKRAFVVFYKGEKGEKLVDNCRVIFTNVKEMLEIVSKF
ncbi:MAG: ATP-binding protein [Nanoarchaeota archaeon]